MFLEKAAAECISDDALIHLKSYKYSSVDKSPVSKYILGPWVREELLFFGTDGGGGRGSVMPTSLIAM